jgi:hypothetical protein
MAIQDRPLGIAADEDNNDDQQPPWRTMTTETIGSPRRRR